MLAVSDWLTRSCQDQGVTIDLTFRDRRVVRDRALVIAIVNRTPDSFYDKAATFAPDVALPPSAKPSTTVPTSSTSAA